MRNPYAIDGPAVISTSGGRTSGFMLRQVMDAHGGVLPDDVIPVFCNTGQEHESTLKFLKDMQEHWGVRIVWLEYRYTPEADKKNTYVEVDYCTASRDGQPFSELVKAKSMLPNPITRFCTSELKISTTNRWCKEQGWDEWERVVGLRYDEPRRVHKLKGNIKSEDVSAPMHDAKHTREDVMQFWSQQDFDLELPGDDDAFGNCVGCFLKGKAKLEKVAQSNPRNLEWWAKQEERTDIQANAAGQFFRNDRPTYRQMLTQLTVQGRMFDDAIEDDTMPCSCHD